jgi:hypothetical protein
MILPSLNFLLLAALGTGLLLGCKTGQAPAEVPAWVEDLERENAELRDRVETLELRLEVILRKSGVQVKSTPAYPRIAAIVLDVKPELDLVLLDKGEKDGVKKGYHFVLYRGSTYKGEIRIQDVQESMSTGLILNEMNPIARGDAATTQL